MIDALGMNKLDPVFPASALNAGQTAILTEIIVGPRLDVMPPR